MSSDDLTHQVRVHAIGDIPRGRWGHAAVASGGAMFLMGGDDLTGAIPLMTYGVRLIASDDLSPTIGRPTDGL